MALIKNIEIMKTFKHLYIIVIINLILLNIHIIRAQYPDIDQDIEFYISKQTLEKSDCLEDSYTRGTDKYENGYFVDSIIDSYNSVTTCLSENPSYSPCISSNSIGTNEPPKTWYGQICPDVDNAPPPRNTATGYLVRDYYVEWSRPIYPFIPYFFFHKPNEYVEYDTVKSIYTCTKCPNHSLGGQHEIRNRKGKIIKNYVVNSIDITIPEPQIILGIGDKVAVFANPYPFNKGTISWSSTGSNFTYSIVNDTAYLVGTSIGIGEITAKLSINSSTVTTKDTKRVLTVPNPPNIQLKAVAYNDPSISPHICLNAQNQYIDAKFIAIVKPLGGVVEAEVAYMAADTLVPVNIWATDKVGITVANDKIKDSSFIYVRGYAPGKYKIKLKHIGPPVDSAFGEGTVFNFEKKIENFEHFQSIHYVEGTGNNVYREAVDGNVNLTIDSYQNAQANILLQIGDKMTSVAHIIMNPMPINPVINEVIVHAELQVQQKIVRGHVNEIFLVPCNGAPHILDDFPTEAKSGTKTFGLKLKIPIQGGLAVELGYSHTIDYNDGGVGVSSDSDIFFIYEDKTAIEEDKPTYIEHSTGSILGFECIFLSDLGYTAGGLFCYPILRELTLSAGIPFIDNKWKVGVNETNIIVAITHHCMAKKHGEYDMILGHGITTETPTLEFAAGTGSLYRIEK
jgi:hypothetical protein